MIIEFTGVPCSGKSDISHELAVILREQGYSVCEKQYELSRSGKSENRMIAKIAACFWYGLRHPLKTVGYYRLIGSFRRWVYYIYLRSHHCKSQVCILEQGFLQFVGSCFENSEADTEKMDLLFEKLIPSAQMIQVFVTASKETVCNRAQNREDKPFFLQAEDPERALSYAFSAGDKLAQTWRQHKGETGFISVSNEKDNAQHEVAEVILATIRQREIL